MKRILTTVLTAVILLTPATAAAQTVTEHSFSALFDLKVAPVDTPKLILTPEKPVELPKPEPVVYTVVAGDNLTKIGTAHNVEWQRLWAKNTQLKHPDVLNIDDKITIPLPDEVLEREIPAAVSLPKETPGVQSRTVAGVYTAGNTYDYGYCTWYVKNKRGASLPNGLGNANTWYSRAAGMGMAVGSTPRAGAVGTTTRGGLGHVVYVESVNDDGTINISDMNGIAGFGKVGYRTTSASEFLYIY